MENLIFDIGVIMIVATVFAFLARLIKQPLIPAYIFAGVVIGPSVLGLITDQGIISMLSEIGIAFLLFVVGMEMEFKKLRSIGQVAVIGGTIQIILLFGIGYTTASLLGMFTTIEALYLGILFAFSSTMVVVKILSDKKELSTLHGRIIIGILILQDVFAIVALSTFSTLEQISWWFFGAALLKAILLFFVTVLLANFLFPAVFKFSAHSHELLLLSSITVCFLFSMALNMLGFSIAVGAFLAGISLANLPYKLEMISRMISLKDFFATIFFVSLGMEMNLLKVSEYLIPALIFSILIIIFKPLIITFITSFFGYSKKTSFFTGTYLAQISEFSLILVAQGVVLGHISESILTMTVTIAVFTIIISTYFMKFSNTIYSRFSDDLGLFDKISKSNNKELSSEPVHKSYKAIIIGYSILGYSIVRKFQHMKTSFVVIDFNPDVIRKLHHEDVNCIYGDIGDAGLMDKINFKDAEIVVSTIPHFKDTKLLIDSIKKVNHKCQIFVTSDSVHHALLLYDEGADYVILPHFLGGDHVSLMLEEITPDLNKLIAHKLSHIEELNRRKHLGHHHPFKLRPKYAH